LILKKGAQIVFCAVIYVIKRRLVTLRSSAVNCSSRSRPCLLFIPWPVANRSAITICALAGLAVRLVHLAARHRTFFD